MIWFMSVWDVGIEKFLCITFGYLLVMYASLQLSMYLKCYHKLIIIITFACILVLFIGMFRYNNLMCLLWLTSMILLWLWVWIFGKADLCEVSIFCTMFTLTLFSQAVKSLCMLGNHHIWYTGLDFYHKRLMLVYLFVLLRLLQFSSFTGVWFFTAFFILWQ